MQIKASASYGMGSLTFNKIYCGNSFFDDGISPDVTGLLLHEFAHNVLDEGTEHGARWYAEFQRLAGLTVHYAITDDSLKNWLSL